MKRRDLIAPTLVLPFRSPAPTATGPRFIKGICSAVFTAGTPYSECFRQVRNAGFDAVEVRMEDRGVSVLNSESATREEEFMTASEHAVGGGVVGFKDQCMFQQG